MFLQITHANGQTSEVEVGDAHTLKVLDENGQAVAVVSFAGVSGFALSPTSLYEVAAAPSEEEALAPVEEPVAEEETVEAIPVEPEVEPVAEEPEPAVEPDAPAEPEPVAKPRRSFGKK